MMLLPKGYKLVEMAGGYVEDVTNIGLGGVARIDGIRAVRERDCSIRTEVDNDLDLGIEAVNMRGS